MTKEDIEIQAALYEDSCHNPSVQQHFIDGAEWAKEELIITVYHSLEKVLAKEMLRELRKIMKE